jgi:hypothetical protein
MNVRIELMEELMDEAIRTVKNVLQGKEKTSTLGYVEGIVDTLYTFDFITRIEYISFVNLKRWVLNTVEAKNYLLLNGGAINGSNN